jgi:hypothetical protein
MICERAIGSVRPETVARLVQVIGSCIWARADEDDWPVRTLKSWSMGASEHATIASMPRSSIRRLNPIAGPLEHGTDGTRDCWSMRPPALSRSGWSLPGSGQLPSVATTSSGIRLERPLTSGVGGRSGAALDHWNTGPWDQGPGGSPKHASRVYGRREQVSSELRRPNPQPATGAASLRQRASLFPGPALEHRATGLTDHRNAGTWVQLNHAATERACDVQAEQNAIYRPGCRYHPRGCGKAAFIQPATPSAGRRL